MSMPNLSLEMNDEGSSSASQRSNFRPCHNSPEWLRSIQNWRGYVPADEISALIDACDNAPFAAVKSGSVDDRDDGRNNRETSQIRVCFGLPCALAGAEPFCDAITSTGSGLRIIHETCMARCWMAPVRNGRRRRHIRYRPRGDGEVSSGVQPTLSNETLSAYTNAVGYGVLKVVSPSDVLSRASSLRCLLFRSLHLKAKNFRSVSGCESSAMRMMLRNSCCSSTTPRPAL